MGIEDAVMVMDGMGCPACGRYFSDHELVEVKSADGTLRTEYRCPSGGAAVHGSVEDKNVPVIYSIKYGV